MEDKIFLNEEEEKAYRKQQEIKRKREQFVETIEKYDNIVFDEYVPVLKEIYVAEPIEVREFKTQEVEAKVDFPEVPEQIQPVNRTFEKVQAVNIPEVERPNINIPEITGTPVKKTDVPNIKVNEVTAEFVQPECKISGLPYVRVDVLKKEVNVSKTEIKDVPEQPDITNPEIAFEQPEIKINSVNKVIPETVSAKFTISEPENIELEKVHVDTSGVKKDFTSLEVTINSVPEVSISKPDRHFEMPEMENINVPNVEVACVKTEFIASEVKLAPLPEISIAAPKVHFEQSKVTAEVAVPKIDKKINEVIFIQSDIKVDGLPKVNTEFVSHRKFKETDCKISSIPKKTLIPEPPEVPEINVPKDKMVIPESCREIYEKGIEIPDATKLFKALNLQ